MSRVAMFALYQVSPIMTHRDGFPRFSARSAWRGDAPASRAAGEPAVGVSGASKSLDDAPHRPRLPSCPPLGPADRPRDPYGSFPWIIGIGPSYRPTPAVSGTAETQTGGDRLVTACTGWARCRRGPARRLQWRFDEGAPYCVGSLVLERGAVLEGSRGSGGNRGLWVIEAGPRLPFC